MADNLTMNAGSGGATLATDDVSSVHYQRVKLDIGADGATSAVTASNPMPVIGTVTDDAAFTPATDKVLMVGAQADDDTSDAVDEGDAGALRMTKERKLRIVAAIDSAAMQSGNDEVVYKHAVISCSSSGDNTIIAGVVSKKLRVLAYTLTSSGTVNGKWQSSTGGDISGLIYMVASSGASPPFNPGGHFQTVAGEDLQLNLSGAIAVGGHLTYIEVD